MLPTIGQVYSNPTDPCISLLITAIETTADGALIEACHPDDMNDMSAPGFEFSGSEFADYCSAHGLSLSSSNND